MKRENLLMVSDSDHNADMLYAVGMFVPDPFIYARVNGRAHIVMSDLEMDRAREEAAHCRVVSLTRLQRAIKADSKPLNTSTGRDALALDSVDFDTVRPPR